MVTDEPIGAFKAGLSVRMSSSTAEVREIVTDKLNIFIKMEHISSVVMSLTASAHDVYRADLSLFTPSTPLNADVWFVINNVRLNNNDKGKWHSV